MNDVFEEGAEAYSKGFALDDNPFGKGDRLHAVWAAGFKAAESGKPAPHAELVGFLVLVAAVAVGAGAAFAFGFIVRGFFL